MSLRCHVPVSQSLGMPKGMQTFFLLVVFLLIDRAFPLSAFFRSSLLTAPSICRVEFVRLFVRDLLLFFALPIVFLPRRLSIKDTCRLIEVRMKDGFGQDRGRSRTGGGPCFLSLLQVRKRRPSDDCMGRIKEEIQGEADS
mmetsp:Transcript_40948/g.80742  ORF Transcript_40948/g.80742 Transcript_40948/m.80742 type:complete len:141 (-) Transcript_40948:345-767(-)